MMNLCFSLYENKFKKKPLQRGTNGRCSTLVEESNGVQAAVNDR